MAGSNQTLQIKMFGNFSMKNGNYAFPQEKKKSKQVGLLFLIENFSISNHFPID